MDDHASLKSNENDAILQEVLEKLMHMHNPLGHQLIAVQSVCSYLISEQCLNTGNPIAAVHQAIDLLSGTGIALADNLTASTSLSQQHESRDATEVLERIATMAEQTVILALDSKIGSIQSQAS